MINDLRQRRKETRPKPSKNFEKTQRFPFGTTFFFGFLLVGFICVFISIFHRWKTFSIDQQLERNFYSAKIIHLFGKFDRDQNEQLSIDEFEPLALEFLSKHQRHESQLDFQDDDQIVTIDAFFEPLNLSTTNEFSRRRQFTTNLDDFHFLKQWREVRIPRMNFGARHFKSFLPKEIVVGKTFWLIEDDNRSNQYREHLSANRFYPPDVEEEKEIFHKLLSMFHPRPFIISRFPPRGCLAVVRARHGPILDIFFRLHAEFQLNVPPYHPFWFTPGQFQGRLIIREDASELIFFEMRVPNDKRLNVDMEWLTMRSTPTTSMEVDIGFINRMEVRSAAPSVKFNQTEINSQTLINRLDENIYRKILHSYEPTEGDGLMNEKQVFQLLERTFYPFKEIEYFPFSEAFRQAEKNNKLVHTVVLWGALDDQSC